MKGYFKNIFTFFMLIIGLVIFSHSIIPHDHHYDVITDINHEEHHEKNKTENEPIHCHYFNDFVISNVTVSAHYSYKQISKIISNISEFEIYFNRNTVLKVIFYSDFSFLEYFSFIDISPTRGSPSK